MLDCIPLLWGKWYRFKMTKWRNVGIEAFQAVCSKLWIPLPACWKKKNKKKKEEKRRKGMKMAQKALLCVCVCVWHFVGGQCGEVVVDKTLGRFAPPLRSRGGGCVVVAATTTTWPIYPIIITLTPKHTVLIMNICWYFPFLINHPHHFKVNCRWLPAIFAAINKYLHTLAKFRANGRTQTLKQFLPGNSPHLRPVFSRRPC